MRIHSPTIWLLSASLAGMAMGTVSFNSGLNGLNVPQNGTNYPTTILNYTALLTGNGANGYMMQWSFNDEGATVNSIILALEDPATQIASGPDNSSATLARSLDFQRDLKSQPDLLPESTSFSVDETDNSLTFTPTFVTDIFSKFQEQRLFFQLKWSNSAGETEYSYSPPWAVVESQDASELLSRFPSLVAPGTPAYSDSTTPKVTPASSTSGASIDASSSSTTTSPAASSSAADSRSKGSSGGLSTGAIVGIAIGGAAALMFISVVAGCLCFRRRRNNGVRGEDGTRDVHAMQDIIAEKEARVGILDGDQPDTPYSEQDSHRAIQHPLGIGLGMTGLNESGVDMGIGRAISRDGEVAPEGHYAAGGTNRNSGVYSSLGGAPAPVVAAAAGSSGSPTHERSSMVSSPAPRTSTQQDRAFSPYTDHPVIPGAASGTAPAPAQQQQHDHSQHHHVVDGADLVQQEQSNDKAARSPTRTMTPDQQQPISPDAASARDTGSVGGGTPRMRAARFGSRSATPSGISGRYAHLVEEGMTDDEIRRLEEEERALDEAIEQAGRGR